MPTEFGGSQDATGRRFALVISRYSPSITNVLKSSAEACLAECGVAAEDVEVFWVPGSYELSTGAQWAVDTKRFEAVIALGCVVRGETAHDRYISAAVADGLTRISLASGIPVQFGVITANTPEQAVARSGERGKGWEAALAAVEMVGLATSLGRTLRG